MDWVNKLIGGGFEGLANGVTKILGSFGIKNAEQEAEIGLAIQELAVKQSGYIAAEIQKEMEAKERVLVAELTQGDDYTKRARPTVVYAGLIIIVINHIILPWVSFYMGYKIPEIEIPEIFWVGWSGIVMTWSIGRTVEKRTGQGNIITGKK